MENKTTNRAKLIARLQFHSAVIVKWHHKQSVLLYFSAFSGWPAWFFLQIFCLNNKIHFSSGLKMTVNENLWMKQPTIPPWLAGKIVKYRPLSKPIRLQDLEDFRLLYAWKKIKYVMLSFFFLLSISAKITIIIIIIIIIISLYFIFSFIEYFFVELFQFFMFQDVSWIFWKYVLSFVAWFVVIFGINTTGDISKLLWVISQAARRVKFETILKYHA